MPLFFNGRRGVAQPGSASALGAEGRRFESCRPDQVQDKKEAIMLARIHRPAKTAMQSGRAKTQLWELTFAPATARTPDPLMGWTQSTDMNGQVRLSFETREAAVAYATRHGIAFEVLPEEKPARIVKSYADNFAFHRKQPWTH